METIEWDARWSGGMKESAIKVADGKVISQRNFSRHVRHISDGSELYRAEVGENETVLLLYISGSGRTQTAKVIHGQPAGEEYRSWDEAEQFFNLPDGSIEEAFYN